MFDPSKLGEMFSQIQSKAKELEEQGGNTVFTAKSGGGMVSVGINGNFEVVDITIDDAILEDKESLQILLISALNDALKMVEDNKKNMAMNMLGGFAGGGFGN